MIVGNAETDSERWRSVSHLCCDGDQGDFLNTLYIQIIYWFAAVAAIVFPFSQNPWMGVNTLNMNKVIDFHSITFNRLVLFVH